MLHCAWAKNVGRMHIMAHVFVHISLRYTVYAQHLCCLALRILFALQTFEMCVPCVCCCALLTYVIHGCPIKNFLHNVCMDQTYHEFR